MRRQGKASLARRSRLLLGVAAALALTLVVGVAITVATAPSVTVEDATEVGYTAAQVKGMVDRQEQGTTYRFQYATQADFSDAVTGIEALLEEGGPGAQEVTGELTGLAANTTYHLRLQAENGDGLSEATAASTFTTKEVKAPEVTTNDAEEVGYTTAKASGTVDPQGSDEAFNAYCQFEYVSQAQFEAEGFAGAGATGCDVNPVTGSGATEVKADLSGLTPGTEYHLRLVATNAGGMTAVEAANTFATPAVAKPVVSIDPVTNIIATSAHFSGLVNPNAPGPEPQDPAFDTHWSFECVPACFKEDFRREGTVVADNADHAVEADVALEPNTEYTVTLRASNKGGESTDQTSFKTPAVAPEVLAWNTWATKSKALLSARVNPHNSATTYRFEYGDQGPCSSNPCAALPSGNAGPGGEPQIVSRVITGLKERTTYNFRLIAEGAGMTVGPDRTVTTGPGDRAYEMVSPPDKNGGTIDSNPMQTRPSVDGDAVMFSSHSGFADARGVYIHAQYIAQREPDGWRTHTITPPQHSNTGYFLANLPNEASWQDDFSDDLSTGVFLNPVALTSENPDLEKVPNLYLGRNLLAAGSATFEPLTEGIESTSVNPTNNSNRLIWPSGTSSDFSHVLFSTPYRLTPEAPGNCADAENEAECPQKLYDWHDGSAHLAGMVPVAPATQCGGEGPACVPASTSFAGIHVSRSPGIGLGYRTPNAISEDGSRIFFTASPLGERGFGGRVFVREDGESTTQLNVSERTNPESPQPAELWWASPDGSRALFITRESLVDADTNANTNHPNDLYMVDLDAPAGERLTLISANSQTGAAGGGAYDVLGASDDGSVVYFLNESNSPLIPGQETPRETPVYVWHNGVIRLVGIALNEKVEGPPLNLSGATLCCAGVSPDGSAGSIDLGHDVRVTPAGGLVFTTAAPQADGYDNTTGGKECSGSPGESKCAETYVFEPELGELRCVSCDPAGTRPVFNDGFTLGSDWFPGAGINQYESTVLTEDGERVFFSSSDPLVPQDSNGRYDAYEYDVQTRQIWLISSGQCNCSSFSVGATPDGEDAYFTTNQPLVGIDFDKSRDLYDARVGGGIATQNPVAPVLCQGDACQPPPQAPNDPTPASAGFNGPGNPKGNPTRRRCGKGKRRVRSRGAKRCLRKKRHRHANQPGRHR